MSTTKIVLNRQSDLILTGATIVGATGIVKSDISELVDDLTALGLADAAEAIERANGDTALQNAITAAEDSLNAAILSGNQNVIDALNAYVISNDSALSSEVSSRIAADISLQSNINAEEARALAAELGLANDIEAIEIEHAADVVTLQANIDNEQARAEEAESTLSLNLSQEVADRISDVNEEEVRAKAAESTLTTNLAAEVTRATGAEVVLQSNIDTEKGRIDAILIGASANADNFAEIVSIINSVDTENDQAFAGYVLSNDAALAAEVTRATGAEGVLTTDLNAEVIRATGAEDQLTTDLASEEVRAKAAESSLDSKIDTEISNRTSADTAFTNSLNNEIGDRIAGDQTVQTNLDNEVTRATTAEGVLRTDLATEVSNRIDAVSTESTRAITAENEIDVKLNAEVTRASDAEGVLTTDLNAEVARATEAERVLTTDLKDEYGRAKAAEGVLTTDLNVEIGRAKATEMILSTDLSAEVTRANGAEVVLQSNIDTEKGRIDAILDGSAVDLDQFREVVGFVESIDLDNDASLLAAVTDINVTIDAEVTARKLAISKESAARLVEDDKLRTQIDAEVLRATDAEAALDGKIADIISNVDFTAIDSFSEVENAVNTAIRTTTSNLYEFTEVNRPTMVGFQESPDGIKVEFTTDVMIGTQIVFLNGLMQLEGVDYGIANSKVTFVSAPMAIDKINVYGVSVSSGSLLVEPATMDLR